MSLCSLHTQADSRASSFPAKCLAEIRLLPPISPKVDSLSLDYQELMGFGDKPCPQGYASHSSVLERWAGFFSSWEMWAIIVALWRRERWREQREQRQEGMALGIRSGLHLRLGTWFCQSFLTGCVWLGTFLYLSPSLLSILLPS